MHQPKIYHQVNNLRSKVIGEKKIGLIAGSSSFPLRFIEEAKAQGVSVVAICHKGETDKAIERLADQVTWIKVGELGKIISTFKSADVRYAAMAGGISRIKLFGGIKLDVRGAMLLARLRSAKDDVILRGIAEELLKESVEFVPCSLFLESALAPVGILSKRKPTSEEERDITIGIEAIRAMSAQDIGQVVVVKEGVIVAVEAIEGTDACILRGGELAGKGAVVVKFSKVTQDLRFDVPTVGVKTIETMKKAGARVLALEAGKCFILDREKVVSLADKYGMVVVGL